MGCAIVKICGRSCHSSVCFFLLLFFCSPRAFPSGEAHQGRRALASRFGRESVLPARLAPWPVFRMARGLVLFPLGFPPTGLRPKRDTMFCHLIALFVDLQAPSAILTGLCDRPGPGSVFGPATAIRFVFSCPRQNTNCSSLFPHGSARPLHTSSDALAGEKEKEEEKYISLAILFTAASEFSPPHLRCRLFTFDFFLSSFFFRLFTFRCSLPVTNQYSVGDLHFGKAGC